VFFHLNIVYGDKSDSGIIRQILD